MQMRDRTGDVALITGASSGIGTAIAETLVELGLRVALCARRRDVLEALAIRLGGPKRAIAVELDVTDWDACRAAVDQTVTAFGRVDVAIANAGFGAPRGWLESSPEHWRDMVLTNVYGAAITLRAALPELVAHRGDAIITSSVAGRRVLPGSMYSVTKHAATAMAEALRQEVTDRGVRVTSIEPGMVDTPFFDDGVPEWSLQPADIADAVAFAVTRPERATATTLTVRPTGQVG